MDIKKIYHALGGRLIGNPKAKTYICEVISLLPEEIITYVVENIWFLSSPDDAWALTFRGSDVSKQHLIYLSDELFEQNDSQIRYTILHEIGHVILNHRNSIGYQLTQSEIKKQEKEADEFAKKYLITT